MQLTLGPVFYNWDAAKWRDFYFRIADEAPVDVVAVGEVICSKRSPFYAEQIPAVIERLVSAGKTVLLSSLQLISLERERRMTAELTRNEDFMVEVNDISTLLYLKQRPHVLGPFINVYNETTAQFFADQGAKRICLPPELPMESVAAIVARVPDVAFEAFAFGRVPLAISGRCYHARLHKLTKDNCQFVCDKDPDGLRVDTLAGEHFLSMNGVQTLSHTCGNLIGDLDSLKAAGISALRLSPQDCDMVAIARLFRDTLDGKRDADSAAAEMAVVYPDVPFANGFLHGTEGAKLITRRQAHAIGAG